MKFESVRFTHPVTVFGSSSVGMISTLPNEIDRRVDSIEPVGVWVVVTRDGKTRAIPASCVENADVIEGSIAERKK